jgi:hypothetical protein
VADGDGDLAVFSVWSLVFGGSLQLQLGSLAAWQLAA